MRIVEVINFTSMEAIITTTMVTITMELTEGIIPKSRE
jgi:hypothetical protein